jgi:hypothetical protein
MIPDTWDLNNFHISCSLLTHTVLRERQTGYQLGCERIVNYSNLCVIWTEK